VISKHQVKFKGISTRSNDPSRLLSACDGPCWKPSNR
jgi:hypothetical protein